MSTYVFKAVDLVGVAARGEVEADSKQAVADQLRQRGLIVLDIGAKSGSRELNLTLFERVRARDLTVMTRQLSTMVATGMTLLRAFYILEAQTESKLLKRALIDVSKDVEAGLALSDALARHPKIFSPLYIAMIAAGETGGVLESSLLRVADQLEKEDALRRQVRAAMVYPAVVISFALVVMLALVAFVVPVFAKVFKDFGGHKLPALTQVTLAVSHLVTHQWYLLIAGTLVAVFGFRYWRKSERGRPQWDTLRLHIPAKIGDIVQKIALARWSRTLSALVSAGVPLLQAIEITGRTAGNTVIDRAMQDVLESVKAGGTIAAPLRNASVFPPMVTQMIGVGEETGALDSMLTKIAEFYEDEVAAAVKALTSILEPLMIAVVGAIVGFVVISLYLPMFKVYDQIK
ncbi:MAG TPA: type II secretion system F family protein [Solirubrobacteraceae bacterium]|nr:type II secretion system F family protein [Solirubrobacteraceae bacterium]